MSEPAAFEAATARLLSLTDLRRGSAPGDRRHGRRARLRALLQRLGNPHLAVPTIHVAGTNGKGSTAAMIASILSSAGLRVGLFTSPHLHSMTERIRLGLTPISRARFAACFAQVWPAAQAFPQVTTLELLTAMGLHHFREVGAAYQVIEAFVGGRDDTTNIVQPVLSVITNVSRDHVPALGSTLLDIAHAKAGIIKPGVPVVTAPQRPAVQAVLKREARQQGADLETAAELAPARPADPLARPHQELRWRGRDGGECRAALPLRGAAQRENAAVAIAAAHRLRELGAPLTVADVRRGLAQVTWPARFEVLQRQPAVVADGAHCPRAMALLAAELRLVRPRPRLLALVGGQRGHDPVATLRLLRPLADTITAVCSRHPRAMPAAELAAALQAGGIAARPSALPVADTLRQLLTAAGGNDLVLATGSLAVAAEAREALCPAIEADRYPAG